jgi:hypothetical protein
VWVAEYAVSDPDARRSWTLLDRSNRLRDTLFGDRAVAKHTHECSGQGAADHAIAPQHALSLAGGARLEMEQVIPAVAGSGKPPTTWQRVRDVRLEIEEVIGKRVLLYEVDRLIGIRTPAGDQPAATRAERSA